jgi:DNA mismatch repair protein MutS
LDEQTTKDLELEKLFEFITPIIVIRTFRFDAVKDILTKPCLDERAIKYRQDIFEMLLDYPELLSAFETLLPIIDALNYFRSTRYSDTNPMFKLASHIKELESYIGCMDTLKSAFDSIIEKTGRKLSSDGLAWLYDHIQKTCADPTFMHMKQNLSAIAEKLRYMRSVTIGINLSDSLNPIEATVVSINSEQYSDKSANLFNKLFAHTDDNFRGITPLHHAPVNQPASGRSGSEDHKEHPLLRLLFNDISEISKKLFAPLERALSKYARVNTNLFTDLKAELVFFIYGAKFLLSLKENGMPVTKPEIAPVSERVTEIDENYNVNLFIQMLKKGIDGGPRKNLVKSDVSLGEKGRIALITGPNQGGKTVYTQSIGLSQILFQSGMFVPGTRASMSLTDRLFTHFQLEEHMANESGRFADEVKRLAAIMEKVTSSSMLLMNESFASTSYVESLFIAKDVLRICRVTGLRVAFATHFHDLAMQVEEINAGIVGKSRLVSLVSVVGDSVSPATEVVRTFRIVPHTPIGKSYAGEIAYKYGINFEQLYDSLVKRGIIIEGKQN